MNLSDILRLYRLDLELGRVKVVRHRDARFDVEEILRTGWIDTYQAYQGDTIFDNCDFVLAFIGEPSQRSRFLGLYAVKGRKPARSVAFPKGLPDRAWVAGAKYWYDLRAKPELNDLRNRLVIAWNGRIWHRWLTDFEVLEIRPHGRVLPPFQDYLRINLSHGQLLTLSQNAHAHRDWVSSLRAVGGVYLIVSAATGAQYIGSATGVDGIWGRWMAYVDSGHGGNQRLRDLCCSDPRHPAALSFSILETFSRSTTHAEALRLETLFKSKLGSRAFGLNAN